MTFRLWRCLLLVDVIVKTDWATLVSDQWSPQLSVEKEDSAPEQADG